MTRSRPRWTAGLTHTFASAVTVLCGVIDANAQTNVTANSLEELRRIGTSVNNATVTLSPTGGDPHPVTGIVTPGEYWINGDHIADPRNTAPIFMDLSGNGNTYNLGGTVINADTREFAGFGRSLGHGSGVHLVQLTGSNNVLNGLTLIGQDIALDTDPNAQRYADWGTQYGKLTGDNNTVSGATIVVRGSRTDTYGLSDAFGKGSSQGRQPYLGHRKAAGFVVDDATNAVVDGLDLDMHTFGHGFFTGSQVSDTTLSNSTITGELFPSQNVIDRPEYQEAGHTWWGYEIQDDIQLSGSEGGVRTYGGTNFTVDNVVVDGMRTGFATVATRGDVTITDSYAYNTTSGFDVGDNTTITGSGGNIENGPLLVWYTNGAGDSEIELELKGGVPVGVNWSAAYVNGDNVDFTLTSDLAAEDLPEESLVRLGQKYFENWRDADYRTASPDGNNPIPLVNSSFTNNTNQMLVIGENAEGNVGSSQAPVISNGKENHYDGVTLVLSGSRIEVTHEKGLGNGGTETGAEFNNSGDVIYTGNATAQTFDDNATVVQNGATLEIASEVRIIDERVTITGDGVDGRGAIYTAGAASEQARLVGDTIILDGNASIGVGGDGYILLADSVSGTGDFTKRGDGALSLGRSSSLDGNFIVEDGTLEGRSNVVRGDLTIQSGADVVAFGGNMVNAPDSVADVDGTWDLNGRSDDSELSQQIGRLTGSGVVTKSNSGAGSEGTLQLRGDTGAADFTGSIVGAINVEKTGGSTQTFSGTLTHTGTTVVNDGELRVNGVHTNGGAYTVNGGVLGGSGSISAAVAVNDGATLTPGGLGTGNTGTLNLGGNLALAAGSTLAAELASASAYDRVSVAGSASVAGGLDLQASTALPDYTPRALLSGQRRADRHLHPRRRRAAGRQHRPRRHLHRQHRQRHPRPDRRRQPRRRRRRLRVLRRRRRPDPRQQPRDHLGGHLGAGRLQRRRRRRRLRVLRRRRRAAAGVQPWLLRGGERPIADGVRRGLHR